jgi:hypothetical protein
LAVSIGLYQPAKKARCQHRNPGTCSPKTPSGFDQYLAKNPDGFSQAELLLVASWKHHFLPVVTDIAAQTSKLRGAETDVQNAAFGLLRAAATLSQVALDTPQNTDDHFKQLKSVKRALTRIENLLYEDLE